MKEIFLGIDPGYARVGYGLITATNRRPEFVTCGVIETNARSEEGERLLQIESELTKIISSYNVNFAALEQVFFRKDLTTGIRLIEARGVILLTLARAKIGYAGITPTAMKKMITGSGTAPKQQVQLMTARLLSLTGLPEPDDAADGIGLAFCAWLAYMNRRKK